MILVLTKVVDGEGVVRIYSEGEFQLTALIMVADYEPCDDAGISAVLRYLQYTNWLYDWWIVIHIQYCNLNIHWNVEINPLTFYLY